MILILNIDVPICRLKIWFEFKFEIIIENWKLFWQMIVCVRDPIDVWGAPRPVAGPGPLTSSEVHDFTPPTLCDHVGQKGARTCKTSRGVGGKEDIIPPPTPSEVMPRYDTYNRLRARLPFKKFSLNNQSICTCWPGSLLHRLQLGTYTSECIININLC